MAPTFARVDDVTLKKTESEVATVLIHMKNLLRFKNWLRSPLLRLPTEIIIHILSFVMENMGHSGVWRSIFGSCHHIYWIMSIATELWWEVDCRWPMAACIAFARSGGNPQAITAHLNSNPAPKVVLEYWKEQRAFRGDRLHTLELHGIPSDITHFSWIFERPLPRLRHLAIRFSGPPTDEGGELPLPDAEVALLPVTLQLPMGAPLQTLRLRNAMPPWSSNLFAGLRELYLDFEDCPAPVEISEDELFRFLEASSQLERLSLVEIGPRIPAWNNERESTHEQTVKFPSLAFLRLQNSPEVVGYILAHIDTPVITLLRIHSPILSQDVARSLNLVVPDGRVQKRLLQNPPEFRIAITEDEALGSMFVDIGSLSMSFEFDLNDAEIFSNAIMAHLQPLVPPSVTALKIDYCGLGWGELGWREFVTLHPEVRSIVCSNSSGEPMSESLWDALSHTGTDAVPPCPKLESISLFDDPATTCLLNCLLSRRNAGFELEYLRATDVVDGLSEEFGRLVKVLKANGPEDELAEEVRPVQRMNSACTERFIVERQSDAMSQGRNSGLVVPFGATDLLCHVYGCPRTWPSVKVTRSQFQFMRWSMERCGNPQPEASHLY